MPKTIGIDLGTTNSVAAHENEIRGVVEVLLNRSQERGTRSVVGLHKKTGKILVGSEAVDLAVRNPENTISSIKRLMGRFYDDPNVQKVQGRYGYRIVKAPDADDVRVMLGEQMLTPTDVSAIILRKLKEDAKLRLNEEVTHAVITVPAYFSMNQKLATRTAGELAGFRVKQVLDEPTAAAIAYGVDQDPQAMTNILVYDLGGGTFDISILFISGRSFQQLAVEGDMWLGGDDFDHAIMDYVLREVEKEYKVDPSGDPRFMFSLRIAAEKAKIRLGEMVSTAIVLDSAVTLPDGTREDVEVELARHDFEDLPISGDPIMVKGVEETLLRQWCDDLGLAGCEFSDREVSFGPDTVRNRVKKTILLSRKAMLKAGVTKEDIDHVLLVGGSTTIPLVQRMLEEEFGNEKIMRNIDPMQCVAEGAAIAASRIQHIICPHQIQTEDGRTEPCLYPNPLNATVCQNEKCGKPLVAQLICPQCGFANKVDAERCANPDGCPHVFRRIIRGPVTAKPVGVLTKGDQFTVIVPAGTPYPTLQPVVMPFRTVSDAQGFVRIPIYHAEEGEFRPGDHNQWVGRADIGLNGLLLPAGTRLDVAISVDSDSCLDIVATLQDGTGRKAKVRIDPTVGPGERKPASSPEAQGSPEEEPAGNGKWKRRLEYSIVMAGIALREYDWLISDPSFTEKMQRLVEQGKKALEDEDEATGTRLEKEIDEALFDEFKGAMLLLRGEMFCMFSRLEPAIRGRIRSLLGQIKNAIHDPAQDRDDVRRLMEQFSALLDEAAESLRTGTGSPVDDTEIEKHTS